MSFLEKVKGFFKAAADTLAGNKVLAVVIALAIVAGTVGIVLIVDSKNPSSGQNSGIVEGGGENQPTQGGTDIPKDENPTDNPTDTTPDTPTEPDAPTTPEDPDKDKVGDTDKNVNQTSYPVTVYPPAGTNYVYRTDIDMDDNIFMDSLGYTGYNLQKHRADGLMWTYILSTDKRHRGWLTEIGYDYDGSTSGYETNAEGLPDIDFFVKKDMVCASYITYVYFNYIPNVVGTDVSMLCKPQNPKLANDWYKASKQWVLDGYSVMIPFTAKLSGGFIKFEAEREIPIGSLIYFCDAKNKSDWASHVCIYAGYRNGNHWVYHVGNDNGPEFCSIERMHFGPDPQWPIGVIATPSVIEFK